MIEATANPLLQTWQTPYGLPPFELIRTDHFVPAFDHAMHAHRAYVDAIAANSEPPTFDNTLAAFDGCRRELGRIERLFFNLTASETSPSLQAIEREMSPRLAAHHSAIYLDARLFARIDALAQKRKDLGSPEKCDSPERIHSDFVREGRCCPRPRRGTPNRPATRELTTASVRTC
jgi:peptidyl-dipeptidase Dcp